MNRIEGILIDHYSEVLMLEEKWVKSVEKGLLNKNYTQIMQGLRNIGHPIKKEWDTQLFDKNKKIPKSYKFSSDLKFKEFLISELKGTLESIQESSQETQPIIQDLQSRLSQLALFITVWKDNVENIENDVTPLEQSELSASESVIDKKWLHQQIKFKSALDKDDRYAINIALQVMVFKLFQHSDPLIKNQQWLEKFKEAKNKQALIELIFNRIKDLNNVLVKPINLEEVTKENINAIGKSIANFQTPNLKKKLLKYFGISLAFIAAVACGLTTGGAIYLLGPSVLAFAIFLGIFTGSVALQFKSGFTGFAIALICGLAIGATIYGLCLLLTPGLALLFSAVSLGLLTGLFGFAANFGFFSKNFPDFLIQSIQKGSIFEYVNKKGRRKQFSAVYKFLLTPIFALASLTVGAATAALTYITIIKLLTSLLPLLAVVWPPLPIIIAAVLASAIGIALLVAVFTASLDSLKKVAALELGFVDLCKYAYENCKQWLSNLKNLKRHEIVGLFILVALLPVGLIGLAYFRFIAGVDLSEFIGVAGAIVMGVVAYIAQMAFTCLSINKFKNAATKPSASSNDFSSLISNAVGNAVLVYNGSLSSFFGAIACFVNSLCGNMSEADMLKEKKIGRTASLVQEFNNQLTQVVQDEKPSTSTSSTIPLNTLQPQNTPDNFIEGPNESSKPKNYFIRSQSDDPAQHPAAPCNSYNNAANTNIANAGHYRLPKVASSDNLSNQESCKLTAPSASC